MYIAGKDGACRLVFDGAGDSRWYTDMMAYLASMACRRDNVEALMEVSVEDAIRTDDGIGIMLACGYPRCFICRDGGNRPYIFYETEADGRHTAWLMCAVLEDDVPALSSGDMMLYRPFLKAATERRLYRVEEAYGPGKEVSVYADGTRKGAAHHAKA